jgi:hypothetical protein
MKLIYTAACVIAATAIGAVVFAQSSTTRSTSYSIHTPAHKYDFALVSPDGSIHCWGTWDTGKFKELRDRSKEDVLYVRKDGSMYQINDKNTISQTKTALAPVMELGKQQGDLGKQQGALGAKQGELGAKQGEFGRQMGEVARQMAGKGSTAEFERKMKELRDKMMELGEKQKALGEEQGKLGQKQGELGKKQGKACEEAEGKINVLIDNAFAKGLAKKI